MSELPVNVNLSLLCQRFGEIRDSISTLHQYSDVTVEEFLINETVVAASKYTLLIAIEAAISLSTHLTGEAMPQTPDAFARCFTKLTFDGIIPEELSGRLNSMATLRYMLEHVYDQIDDSRLWEILRSDLGDMEEYLDAVYSAVQERSP
jgi:uncharacterized protein YutE (UPF0331/DUF86 family)